MYKDKNRTHINMSEVHQLKVLIHKVLLPRIRQLENEVSSLRKHTWPYVQCQKERSQLDDIEAKCNFFKDLDENTIKELIDDKARISRNTGLQGREYDIIINLRNNFC